jgi:plastocyanin
MGSRLTAVAVVVFAMSLAAPALSAATQPETGLGQAQPAPASEPRTGGTEAATTLKAPPSPTLRAPASASGASAVTIRDFSFNPDGVTVHAGDTVTWTNDGTADHTATGKGFDSGVLHSGKSYSHTFSSPGTFSYVCQIHSFMKGKITVLASSSGASPQQSDTGGSGGSSGSGSSTPSTAGASGSSAGGTGAGGSNGSLPMTGSKLWLLALTGLELAAAGVLLRRLARHRG